MLSRLLFTLFVSLLLSAGVQADAPVWKVRNGDRYLFIGGTIHVLQARDYPLPREFERAYEAAEKLVFEVDIDQVDSPLMQQRLLEAAVFSDGSTLASHLKPETLALLRNFLNERGLPLETVLPFRVGMLVTLLTVNELQRQGIQGEGVDRYFNARAGRDNKPVAALESVEQQIAFISELGEGEEDQIVQQTLQELSRVAIEFATLKSAWRQGNTQLLTEIALDDFQAFPGAYMSMLVDRNRNWIPRIESMLANDEIEYVLVGVLHLVGPDSVLAMLKARGYQVEPL